MKLIIKTEDIISKKKYIEIDELQELFEELQLKGQTIL